MSATLWHDPASPMSLSVRLLLRGAGVLLIGWLSIALVRPVAAQPYEMKLPASNRLALAHAAMTQGEHASVVRILRPLTDQQPGFQQKSRGAAAFWLGEAYAAQRDSVQAHRAWRSGVNALAARERIDVSLFDAYVRTVFRQGIDREKASAAAAYVRLMEQALGADRPSLREDERERLHRHVAQMLLVWPDSMRHRVTSDPEAVIEGKKRVRPGVGRTIAAWWRRQDPRPATKRNERLIEHLDRVVEAETTFEADTFLGFDDRGTVFVRLGAPDERRELRSQSLAKSVSTDAHFIPRNEYWRYHGYGDHSHYVFVKKGGRFQVGGVVDLLPSSLRNDMKGTGALTVLALRDFYDVFVPRIPEYGELYNEVEDKVNELKMQASVLRTTTTRLADSNFDPVSGEDRYTAATKPLYRRARRVQHEVSTMRERELPTARSTTAAREGLLDVAARTARFRNEDGSTRVEVYWGIPPGRLSTPAVDEQLAQSGYEGARRHHVRITARRYDDAYRSQGRARSEHELIGHDDWTALSEVPVFSMRFPKAMQAAHLSLQWDQIVFPRSDAPTSALRAQSSVRWLDSLTALPAGGTTLTMSDLVPVSPETVDGATFDDAGVVGRPYPFESLDPDDPLGLYFEIYNLTFDDADRTRYTVEYAVERTVPKGGLAGLFGRDDTTTTTTATTGSSAHRTTREYLELDLSDWTEATSLTLVVRVTDEVTGQTTHRAIPFDVQ